MVIYRVWIIGLGVSEVGSVVVIIVGFGRGGVVLRGGRLV